MKLFFRELGEGKPFIILHGVFGSSDNWLTVSKELAANYKVYLVDQRNHGQSGHSEIFNYDAMSADLKEFIDEHNLKKPVILGHSMGGKTAMQFVKDNPEIAEKLIVVDISPRYYKRHHDFILEGLNSLDLKTLKSRQEADEKLLKYVPELGVRQFLLKNLYRNNMNEFVWRINLPVITKEIDNVGEALDENTKIDLPTLFMKGANSRYIQEKDEVLIKKIFSNVRIETVEGAGHWVQAEKPEEFLKFVKDFTD